VILVHNGHIEDFSHYRCVNDRRVLQSRWDQCHLPDGPRLLDREAAASEANAPLMAEEEEAEELDEVEEVLDERV